MRGRVALDMKRLPALAVCLVVSAVAIAGALGWDGFRSFAPRFPTADSFDGTYQFCRGMYESDRREAGGSEAGRPTIPAPTSTSPYGSRR